jgi:hypothetical protein
MTTTPEPEVFVQQIESHDSRLGRHVAHDPRSRGFAMPLKAVDRSLWHDKTIRIYDPRVNPNQTVGNCTMCSKAMQLNAVGNRLRGVILNMDWAMTGYQWETANDEFPGAYPPDDTGSSGLAACKTAQHYGVGGDYRWLFGGADEVVQAVMEGHVVSVGTNWYESQFTNPFADHKPIQVAGALAGGHQWTVRGYWKSADFVMGRCWWGSYRDFWIRRSDLDRLLLGEQGDAHVQTRTRLAS